MGKQILFALTSLFSVSFSAFGTVSLSMSQTFPSQVTIGPSNQPASITIVHTSTPPNNTGAITVSGIEITTGCGSSAFDCPTSDAGVFSYSATATGRLGTPFAGITFTFSSPDPTTGEVQLTPSFTPMLGAPGSGNDTGIIDFTFNVLKSPTIDTQPGIPGVQTWSTPSAFGSKDAQTIRTKANTSVTVAKASPTFNAVATPATILLGGSVSNVATLSGGANPTGTITFNLYGITNGICQGAPLFTSQKPVSPGGTTSSASYTPSATGLYRWEVSYSGDANNFSATRPCNSSNSTVNVEFLKILSITKATNIVSLQFEGVASHTYQVQYRNTLQAADFWTNFAGSFLANSNGRFFFSETSAVPTRFYRGKVP
ncbi:MAG: hypothetical protein ABI042_11755 [Verrucomicrobiota bacterium]